MPGGFLKDWSIWCAAQLSPKVKTSHDCPTWEAVEGERHKARAKFVRKLSWRYVTGVGWLCSHCHALWSEGR